VLFKESRQRGGRHRAKLHFRNRLRQRAIFFQRHQHLAEFGIAAAFDQAVFQLRWLHRRSRIERRGERAMFSDQFRCGLWPDPENARHIISRVPHQRQHIAHQFGRDAEFLFDFIEVDALVLHRIEHVDPGRAVRPINLAHQLHQILVG